MTTRLAVEVGDGETDIPFLQRLVAGVVPLTVTGALSVLAPITLALVLPIAAASWFFVEKPAQDRARRLRRAAAQGAAAAFTAPDHAGAAQDG